MINGAKSGVGVARAIPTFSVTTSSIVMKNG
jgi:hypothetical protein